MSLGGKFFDGDCRKYRPFQFQGRNHAATACFRIREFDKDGDLIAESEEAAYSETAPGQTQENILTSHELEHDWVHNPDNKIDVVFRCGYFE